MQGKIGKIFWINLIVLIISVQLVVLINYWYFIYKNVSSASINDSIAYQGKLVDSNGVQIDDGNYNMRFSIYDAAEGGTQLWEETWDGSDQNAELLDNQGSQVAVSGGIFNIELNKLCGNWKGSCKRNAGVDFNSPSLFLQVELDKDNNNSYEETFAPRKRFSSVAYAMNSDRVDGRSVGTSGDSVAALDGDNTWTGVNTITSVSAGNKGLIIKGANSQSANLQEWQLGDGSVVSGVEADGTIFARKLLVPVFLSSQAESGTLPAAGGSTFDYWKFGEGGEQSVADSGTAGLAVSIADGITSTGYFGYSGDKAITFNGTTTKGTVAPTAAYNTLADAGSLELWIKFDDPSRAQDIISFSTPDGSRYWTLSVADKLSISIKKNGQISVNSGATSLHAQTWYHLAVTTDNQLLRVYINGQPETLTADSGSNNGDWIGDIGTEQLGVAIGGLLDRSFKGAIDSIIVWSTQLSQGEIQSHYSAASSTAFVFDTPSEYKQGNSKIFSVRNNGSEKVSIDSFGHLAASALTLDGQEESQKLLTEWKDSSGKSIGSFDSNGTFTAGTLVSTGLKLSGGLITDGVGVLTVTGALPAAGVDLPTGITFALTSQANSILPQRGLAVGLSGTYDGQNKTAAEVIENSVAGNGVGVLGGGEGNYGLYVQSTGQTSGQNAGLYTSASNGTVNVGLYASSTVGKDGAVNIGLLGMALNPATTTPGINVGGYFGLGLSPINLTNAALIADNGDTTADIFKARDNGVDALTVADGGKVGIGSGLPIRTLDVKLPNGGTDGIGIYTNDFVKGSVGSSFAISPSNASGDGPFSIQAYVAGESTMGNLLIQPHGGQTSFGSSSFDGAVSITPVSTSTKGLTIRALANQSAPLLAVQSSDGSLVFSVDADGVVTSSVASGQAPFKIESSTKVDHLNADLLDGYDSSDFLTAGSLNSYVPVSGGAMSGALIQSRNDRATDTVSGDSTINVSANVNVFALTADSADTESDVTTVYELSAVNADPGRELTLFLRAAKGETQSAHQHTVLVQVNGITLMTLTTPYSTSAASSDESRIFRYNPNSATWTSLILN